MSDQLYHDALMDEARRATGHGRLDPADASATIDNPLCGDRVTVQLRLKDGRIAALAHEVRGCVLCKASASMLAERAIGLDREGVAKSAGAMEGMLRGDATAVEPGFEPFRPVGPYKSRHDCVLLPFRAIERALDGKR